MLKAVHDGFDVDSGRAAAHDARHVYSRLLEDPTTAAGAARDYLTDRLAAAERLPSELPDDPRQLAVWSQMGSESVGRQYRRYLNARRGGEGRRFFGCKAHALYFLNRVAPTKLVDGAWLAGLLPYWNDSRFYFLLRTYLEELGDGVPEKNHVVLYRRLIAGYGCENLDALPDDCFVQGAIQLALGRLGTEFLPEVIGYNLGYEQLPLHLLVTAYELDELGIDPYYFTLHVTVDNAASGHAQKAVQALLELLPGAADREGFYRRVIAGYKLNELGAGSMAAIESFELEREVVRVLAAKAGIGAQLHSDYCRIGGKTVSEWLSEPLQISAFLTCLQQSGWIRRNEDPRLSRFWQLIDGERAAMFGVFTPYERQLIHDWIAGTASLPRQPSYRARLRRQRLEQAAVTAGATAPAAVDPDLQMLRDELAALTDKAATMAALAARMAPATHHTPLGLAATQRFSQLLG